MDQEAQKVMKVIVELQDTQDLMEKLEIQEWKEILDQQDLMDHQEYMYQLQNMEVTTLMTPDHIEQQTEYDWLNIIGLKLFKIIHITYFSIYIYSKYLFLTNEAKTDLS